LPGLARLGTALPPVFATGAALARCTCCRITHGHFGSVAKQRKINAVPTVLLIDHKGVVRKRFVGFSESEFNKLPLEADGILKEPERTQR
jgi:hypothetical protein